MRVVLKGVLLAFIPLLLMGCQQSMSLEELRVHMAEEPGLNREFILDQSVVSVRYMPQVVALKQGLENEGHYFELRSEEIESLYKLSEQNFSIYSQEQEWPANLLFIENYGGGMANRAILCFYNRPPLKDKLTLRYKSVGAGMLQDIDFNTDDIESANRINLAL